MVTADVPTIDRPAPAPPPLPTVALSSGIVDAPDHLAGGVLRSLARPLAPGLSWGVLKTGALGVLSFGVLPLLDWTKHLNDMIRFERTQLWHLAEWARLKTGHTDASALCASADGMRTRHVLSVTALLWAGAAAFFVVLQAFGTTSPVRAMIEATYGFEMIPLRRALASSGAYVFAAWTIGLSIAYALHWLRLQLHAADVRRFIENFNRIAEWEAVPPIVPNRVGTGIRPMWIVGAIVLASWNALWGVPMMLAGAAQRRYTNVTGAANRAALAERVSMILSSQRPTVQRSIMQIGTRPACREKLCQTELPQGATFCPRCGTRVAAMWREGI